MAAVLKLHPHNRIELESKAWNADGMWAVGMEPHAGIQF